MQSMTQMLVGRYRFVEKIGAGGFGVVSKFYDVLTDEEVAVKTIPAYYVNCEGKRLIRELDILIFLYNAHPHVIGYYNMFATRVNSHSYNSRNRFENSSCNNSTNNSSLLDMQYNKNNVCNANKRENANQNLPTRLEDYLITEDVDDVPMELNVYGPLYSSLNTAAKVCLHQNKLNEMVQSIDRREEFNVHIVMPLMKGDLLQFISLSSPSSMLRASEGLTSKALSAISVVFAFQVCFGLDFLHKSHVLHRDMKPDNILVRVDAQNVYMSSALIIDLGLARDAQESDTFYICTRYYRPPEMITNSSKGSPAIDIWSLGCIFYEMCTGHILFSLGTALRNGVWDGLKASEQLEEILKKLGTPSITDVQRYMPEGNAKLYLLRSQQRPCRLRELMLEKWRLEMSKEEQQLWIDLTARCLAFFPQQRPSAEELCCHELFRRINIKYNENIFQYKTQPYRPTFRDSALSNKAWIENKYKILKLTAQALQLAIPTDVDEDDNNEVMSDDEESTNMIANENSHTLVVNNSSNVSAPHRVINNSNNVNQFKENVTDAHSDNVNAKSLSPFSIGSSYAQQEKHGEEEEEWELLREEEEEQEEQEEQQEQQQHEEREEQEEYYEQQQRLEYKEMMSAEHSNNYISNNSIRENTGEAESCADRGNETIKKSNGKSEVNANPTLSTLSKNVIHEQNEYKQMVDKDVNSDDYHEENNGKFSFREYVLDTVTNKKCIQNNTLHEQKRLPIVTSEYEFIVKEDEDDCDNGNLQVNYNNNKVVRPNAQHTQRELQMLNKMRAKEGLQLQKVENKHNNEEELIQPQPPTSTYITTMHVPSTEVHIANSTQTTSEQATLTPLVCPSQSRNDQEGYSNQQQHSDLYQQYPHVSTFSPLFMSNTSSEMLYNYNDEQVNKYFYSSNENYNTNSNNSNYFYQGSNEGMSTGYYQCPPYNTYSVNNTEINSKRSKHGQDANSFSPPYSSVYGYSMPAPSQMTSFNTTTTTATTAVNTTTGIAPFPFSQFEDAQLWQYYEPLSRSANGVQNAITTILEDLTTCRHDAARSNRLRELLRYFNNLQNTDYTNSANTSTNTALEATVQATEKKSKTC